MPGAAAVECGSDVHLLGVVHHLVCQESAGLHGAAGLGYALLRGLQGAASSSSLRRWVVNFLLICGLDRVDVIFAGKVM